MTRTWKLEDPITGERLQSVAEATVITESILAFHKSLPQAGVRNMVVFPGVRRSLEPDPKSIAALRGRRIIFVYSHLLDSFVRRVLPRLDHRFVLISHNSDDGVDPRFVQAFNDPRIVHWFAGNLMADHPKLTPLPLGIANAHLRHGRITDVLAAAAAASASRKEIVYCNFSLWTNPIRVPVWERIAASGAAWLGPARPFREYLADMAQCKWCVSPPGNAADCHRTWEALYLGVVPIVFGTAWDAPLHAGLPVIRIGSIEELDLESIRAAQAGLDRRDFDLGPLTTGYWRGRIIEKAAEIPT